MNSIELIQSLYQAFGRGDIAHVLAHVAPDCCWVSNGEGIPYSGEYHGPDGVSDFFAKLGAAETMERFEPKEFFAGPDGAVVALGYEQVKVKATGKTASTNWAMLFRTRGNQVTGFEGFFDTAAYASAHKA